MKENYMILSKKKKQTKKLLNVPFFSFYVYYDVIYPDKPKKYN